MNIVWLSWKDRSHPNAGGAETMSGAFMERLVADGHNVRHITARYRGSKGHEITSSGIEIFRAGNKYSTYLWAKGLFGRYGAGWSDIVIDEMNTIPYAAALYSKDTQNYLLVYQLARQVWFYQMIFPLSLFGYLSEPLMLRTISHKYRIALTESTSSKRDLLKHGFRSVSIFRAATPMLPLEKLEAKNDPSIILSIGAIRPMKRTLHAVKAFELARNNNPKLSMVIAGDDTSSYARKVRRYVEQSQHKDSIAITGRVLYEEKIRLMREAALILVTSIKEGWGLIVTEANTQGTPAIAYDTDGLRDSVQDTITGLLCRTGNFAEMAEKINGLLDQPHEYSQMRNAAWEWSRQFNFTNAYTDFKKAINL